jgi:hypothetical protein
VILRRIRFRKTGRSYDDRDRRQRLAEPSIRGHGSCGHSDAAGIRAVVKRNGPGCMRWLTEEVPDDRCLYKLSAVIQHLTWRRPAGDRGAGRRTSWERDLLPRRPADRCGYLPCHPSDAGDDLQPSTSRSTLIRVPCASITPAWPSRLLPMPTRQSSSMQNRGGRELRPDLMLLLSLGCCSLPLNFRQTSSP